MPRGKEGLVSNMDSQFVLKDTLRVIMKLRDGGCLIFNFGMFSFMKRKVAKSEEFLERIGLRI